MKITMSLVASCVFLLSVSCGGSGGSRGYSGNFADDGANANKDSGKDSGSDSEKDDGSDTDTGSGSDGTDPTDPLEEIGVSKYGIPVLASDKGKPYGFSDRFEIAYGQDVRNPPDEYRPEGFVATKNFDVTLDDGRLLEIFYGRIDRKKAPAVILVDGQPANINKVAHKRTFWTDFISETRDTSTQVQGLGYAYENSEGELHAMYMIDDQNLKNAELFKHDADRWVWENVIYGYAYIEKSSTGPLSGTNPSRQEGGRIYANGDQWTADLGPIQLSGKIDGTEVSGKTKANINGKTYKGEFAGFDGAVSHKDDEAKTFTIGGFGAESDTGVLAGGWRSGTYKKN